MAYKVLCLLALVAAASAAPDGRLVGGSELSIREAPYAASIVYTYPGPGITIQRCVGALISSFHVVTNAFCFFNANLANMRVQAGSTNSLQGGVSRPASRYVAHPSYQAQPRANDIAVLFVSQPFPVSQDINVLYLPPSGSSMSTDTNIRVVGWGFESAVGAQLQNLHAIDVRTISQDACRQAHAGDDVLVDDNSFCTASEDRGLCRGNDGAPAVLSNTLFGVASFYESCSTDYPDVFVNVPRFTDWIMSVAVASTDEGIPARIAI